TLTVPLDTVVLTLNGGAHRSTPFPYTTLFRSVNDRPTAFGDAATTAEDTPINIAVLANDTDVEGDALRVSSVTQPLHGSVSINADGTVRYRTKVTSVGSNQFSYRNRDGSADSF